MAGLLRTALPPTNSLVVFEAAARHMNFTRAARELDVTQSAVSRQIQLLEENLGCALFRRRSRGLALTGRGERLYRAVSMGLEHIAQACGDVRRQHHEGELTVATSVTFASYWLMARLGKFRDRHPDVDLRLLAASPVNDLTAAGVDLAVRYGSGRWPGTEAVRLFDDEVCPVCAPSYLDGSTRLSGPADLLDETLLSLATRDRNWVTWAAFLENFGIEERPRRRGVEFDNYMLLIQAALKGEGIALCGRRLAEDFIVEGSLIRPIDEIMASERGFYLIRSRDAPLRPQAKLFHDWLCEEAGRA